MAQANLKYLFRLIMAAILMASIIVPLAIGEYVSAATVTINQSAYDADALVWGGIWRGERFNNFTGNITEVRWYLRKYGAPTGLGTASVYRVSDGALLGTLGTTDVSNLTLYPGSPSWVTFNSSSVYIGSATDIRIAFGYSGGNASNYVGIGYKASDVTAFGVYTYGTPWSDYSAWDATFIVTYIVVPTAPSVTTLAATSVSSDNATLSGNITSIGSDNVTSRGFDWGTATGNYTSSWTESGNWTSPVSFSHQIATLTANTTYYFRAKGTNLVGTSYGGELSLTTLPTTISISVLTNDATNLTPTGATLQGTLQALSGIPYVSVSFQYGTTASYGVTTQEQAVVSTGTFNAAVIGLRYGTTYHFRAVVRTGTSYYYGADNYFTTLMATGSSTDLVIVSAAVFSNYLQTGDLLFCAEVVNTYTGYYPNLDPKRYFTIQLLDTNNTDILGASVLPNWGDRPVSIYKNATDASTLVAGSAYYIRMIGTLVPGTPSVEYQLQESDWQGYDFSGALDDWARGVATNMQVSDQRSDYLTVLTDVGVVIADPAGGYFSTGIPGITQVRPNLFTTSQQVPVTPSTAAAPAGFAVESETAWETFVGSAIASDIAIIGLPFGISGKNLLAIAVFMVIIGCMMTVTATTGGFGALGAALIAVPILWLGVWWRIVPVMFLLLLIIGAAILFLRQFVVKTL